MHHIIRNKSTGKTRELLELAKNKNALVVCSNPAAMAQKARAYGIVGLDFCSYEEKINLNEPGDRPILFDELDSFLKAYNENIIGYSLSEE